MAIKLLHWEKIVSDISEGLCVAKSNVIPYFLPSLAILSIACNAERYFTKSLLGAYL